MKIISNAVKDNFKSTGGIEYKEEKLIITSPNELMINQDDVSFANPALEERFQQRLNFQQARKQHNIEGVTAFAAESLKEEQPITDEPVDDDWITRFFSIAEDVSNVEMQALWGRILAGEVKQLNSFSLRTLEMLKTLSKAEADVITKMANLVIELSGTLLLFKGLTVTI